MAEQLKPEEVVVLLGTPTEDSSRLYAMTVTDGDPAWAGALAGIALRLPVYHITEPEVRAQIAPPDWEEHVALMEVAMDVSRICEAVRSVRESSGAESA